MVARLARMRLACALTGGLAAALVAIACGGATASAPATTAPSAEPPRSSCDANVAQLERELDDARRRALEARQEVDRERGESRLTEHELDALRERDAFEDSIWSRLDQLSITEGPIRERLMRLPRRDRAALAATLRDVDAARDSVEHAIRRVRKVPDVEWPRYRHDLESTVEGVDRMLRDAQ